MEKTKKLLKQVSIFILIFAGLSLVQMILELVLTDFDFDSVPDDVSQEAVEIITYCIIALSFVCLIPSIFIGVRGIQIAKNPTSKTGHIKWAKVLLVFAIISMIISISDVINSKDLVMDITAIVNVIIDIMFYVLYIKYASQLKLENSTKK